VREKDKWINIKIVKRFVDTNISGNSNNNKSVRLK